MPLGHWNTTIFLLLLNSIILLNIKFKYYDFYPQDTEMVGGPGLGGTVLLHGDNLVMQVND